MKNSLLAATLAFVSTSAFAANGGILPDYTSIEGSTSVTCSDARQIVDAGIQVKIVEHNGSKVLELFEESFTGARALGSAPVSQIFTQERGNQDIFMGNNVQLVIDLDSAQTPDIHNDGILKAYVRGTVGAVHVDNDVNCQFFSRSM